MLKRSVCLMCAPSMCPIASPLVPRMQGRISFSISIRKFGPTTKPKKTLQIHSAYTMQVDTVGIALSFWLNPEACASKMLVVLFDARGFGVDRRMRA